MMIMMMMMTMVIDIYIYTYMDQNLYLAVNLDGSRPFLVTGKCHVWDAIVLSQKRALKFWQKSSDDKIMHSVAWKKWLNSMVFGGYNYS